MSTTQQRIALITGVTGQDGAYLAELLLKKKGLAAVIGIAPGTNPVAGAPAAWADIT